MGFNYILPLRIAQLVLAFAVLVSAAVAVHYDFDASSEPAFMVFVPIFTFLALAYLVGAPIFLPSIHNEWVVLGVEAVTWVLWLAGFAALAAMLEHYACLNVPGRQCAGIEADKAAIALGAFEWLAFCFSLGLTIHAIVQSRRGAKGEGAVAEEGGHQMQYAQGTPAPPVQQPFEVPQQTYPHDQSFTPQPGHPQSYTPQPYGQQ